MNNSNIIRWSVDLRWCVPDKPNGFYGLKVKPSQFKIHKSYTLLQSYPNSAFRVTMSRVTMTSGAWTATSDGDASPCANRSTGLGQIALHLLQVKTPAQDNKKNRRT